MSQFLDVLNSQVFLAAAIGLLAVFALIILLIYNHKSTVRNRALQDIDKHIAEGGAAAASVGDAAVIKEEVTAGPEAEDAEKAEPEPDGDEGSSDAAEEAEGGDEPVDEEHVIDRRTYNVGRSGKVYSRDELEQIIKG